MVDPEVKDLTEVEGELAVACEEGGRLKNKWFYKLNLTARNNFGLIQVTKCGADNASENGIKRSC